MANFITRLVTRHLGLTSVVQPFIAPMFASETVALGSWRARELGRVEFKADLSSSGTDKMPIPQAETSNSGEVGVSPVQARDASSSSQPYNLVPSLEQSNTFSDAISAISSEAIPIQQTPDNPVNRVQPLVEWTENIQPNTSVPLDTSRSQNVQEMRSHLAHPSPLTEPSFSQTPKADTPQNPIGNFIATPPTQASTTPGMIQRQVDASLRSHSSIDSPVNPPNSSKFGGFVVEDISLEQPSPVKPTLPLVPPQTIPSVQPTTTNAPSRVEPLINEVLETEQQTTNTQYGLEPTYLIPPSEDTRESNSPHLLPNLQGEDGGERPEGQGQKLTELYGDNTQEWERDRSNVQPNSQTSNLVQPHTPKETQPTPSVQASPASEMIQPLTSAESPISPPIQAPQSQSSPHPNSVQDPHELDAHNKQLKTLPPFPTPHSLLPTFKTEVPNTATSFQLSATPQRQNQGNAANINLPELPLVPSETVLPIPHSAASKPNRVEPLINIDKSIISQQNTSTSRSSEQMRGQIEGEMRQSLPNDSSSKPAPTVPSRIFSPQETFTGSNPPLHATAPRREFLQLVPQQNVDDPPKSPLKRGTLSRAVSPVNRESVSHSVPPLKKEIFSDIIPPLKRGARGDRAISNTVETPPESSSAIPVQVQSEKLSALTRRSLSVLSQSSSRQSKVYPITHDVPEFPSSQPTHRRNAANFDPTTRLNPVETTPTIQISIGRIEVRASQPQTPPPRTKSTQRGPTQSLQDYLKQRQGGNS